MPEAGGRQSRHSFRFALSDECNAQSAFTVEVELGGEGRRNKFCSVKDVKTKSGCG